MGRVMTWHRDLSDRAAAEIVTRHLPNNRSSVIDRIRKSFAKDREYYLRTGKMNEIINLVMRERERQGLPTKTKRMEITKSHYLHWYFPTMTPWKPYSRNYDQSWEPSAGSLIRTPWWSFLSWEKFGQNKSQALPSLLFSRPRRSSRRRD